MKHLKLFEQDNWWENSTGFGEEESREEEWREIRQQNRIGNRGNYINNPTYSADKEFKSDKIETFENKKYLKLFEQFTDVESDIEVWTPVKDKLGFYEPKPIMKSELDKTVGFEKGLSVPFFKTRGECKQWCDDKDMDMFQNMDR